MKLGILIPGLGEAFSGITVRNYAKRLAKEMDVNTDSNIKYLIQEEKFEYNETITHCLSIYSDFNDKTNLEYRLYDFSYSSTLCKEFKEKNAIAKCFLLFLTIGSKSSSNVFLLQANLVTKVEDYVYYHFTALGCCS
jgi:hypothetical protein